ncbi:MAG: AAA family ATPase [Lachnospiraceae bacterium]|nr:AAA family ATPase [Lachnospiraceae bacterium]
MGIYLNPKNVDFQRALNSEIYVDKTELIAYTNRIMMTEQQYISVSRPRRFGKSMAANMLTAYYSQGADSQEMFAGLKIAQDVDFKKHLNQYPVIRLNMQNFLSKAKNMDDMIARIEKHLLFELTSEFSDVVFFDDTDLQQSLQDVFAKHAAPFVFIFDEWDCIFRIHKTDLDAQTKYLDFLRALLKDQSYVGLAYMTGILPIKKYGQHSALNMFYEYSMMDASPIEEFTGFTEEEVKGLCERYQISYEDMKKWYDGYRVSGISVYNPKSVVESIMRRCLGNYWTKTETYEALKPYIQMDMDGLREKVKCLIAGEKVSANPQKYQNDMTTFGSADDVLTLLVHLGYLTLEAKTLHDDAEEKADVGLRYAPDARDGLVECIIPNSEVRQEFINCIEDGGWEPVMDAICSSEDLLNLTIAGDESAVATRIAKVHQDNSSILQYNHEVSLSCAISLAYYSAKKSYTVIREMPAVGNAPSRSFGGRTEPPLESLRDGTAPGKGFADLVFVPDRNCPNPAMVVELKWDKSVETALDQIRKQHYAACLERYHGEILLVGVNYDKESKEHTCKIERMRK